MKSEKEQTEEEYDEYELEFTIHLSPEGQARLVEMIEDENPKPLPERMHRAKEESDRLFGEPF